MLVDSFNNYLLSQKRYSSKTALAYVTDIVQFQKYILVQFQIELVNQVSSPMIRSWLAGLSEKGINPSSLKRKLSSLNTYFKFLQKNGELVNNPAKGVATPKIPTRIPRFLNTDSVENLFKTSELFPNSFEGARDKLILEFLYGTGIRRQELVSLTWQQCDFNKRQIKILGKGNKERMIPLGTHLVSMLEEYKEGVLNKFNKLPNSIFILDSGQPLYPEFVYRKVNHYLKQVTTIDKKSPHVMRHTFATHLSNKGADLNDIKELMGHSSLASTQIYTHSSIEELKKIYKQAHPLS